jgi:hypothetical protein
MRKTFCPREGSFASFIKYILFEYQMNLIINPDKRFPRAAFIPYPIAFGNHAHKLRALSNLALQKCFPL